MLKQSKIILKSLTSFHWHPYWSCFIRSLRNVRLNKIFERTYQDGTGVGLAVDKERGVFGTNVCTYHKDLPYGVAKELPHIIKLLVGQSPNHLKNTQHFIQQLQGKKLEPGETITSFDVKALFTSVPVQPSIQIVKQRLQQDNTLPQRTSMSIQQITSLLEFCLSHTYFLFQGKYYEQVQGAAMGSPISLLIANIFMEEFEVKALSPSPTPLPFGSGL